MGMDAVSSLKADNSSEIGVRDNARVFTFSRRANSPRVTFQTHHGLFL